MSLFRETQTQRHYRLFIEAYFIEPYERVKRNIVRASKRENISPLEEVGVVAAKSFMKKRYLLLKNGN